MTPGELQFQGFVNDEIDHRIEYENQIRDDSLEKDLNSALICIDLSHYLKKALTLFRKGNTCVN
jgi:hypothetical protein